MNPGARYIGHLRVDGLLGEGGMGKVFAGFDPKLERRVAIKALRRRQRWSSANRSRFVREARMLSKLTHPGICQVYDLLEHGGEDYLVLEYIEGQTLREVDLAAMTQGQKLRLAAEVCEAIAVAHRQGIVHRDLKPANVMVTPEGRAKVLDFGLARPAEQADQEVQPPANDADHAADQDAEDPDATELQLPGASPSGPALSSPTQSSAGTFGTLAYMSPEQARGEPVAEPADIYSFGVLLQEMLTGRRAYPSLDAVDLVQRVRHAQTRPVDGLAPELASLVRSLQDPDPRLRPTAEATLESLHFLLAQPERRRRRRLIWIAVTAMALLVLGAVWTNLRTRLAARRAAAVAQEIQRAASDAEIQLRALYLGPSHDLRPTLAGLRQRLERLRQEAEALGSVGRGPGQAALGRLALALRQPQEAQAHLEAAWEVGYRTPETALLLGMATFERYRRELSRVQQIRDPQLRERQLAVLRRELRDPSLDYLEQGRPGLADPESLEAQEGVLPLAFQSLDYVEALIAFHEDQTEQALARSRAALERWPLLYAAEALIGRIHQTRAEQLAHSGEIEAMASELEAGRAAFLRAAEIGRSDPQVHVGLCELKSTWINLAFQTLDFDFDRHFDEGVAACEKARDVDRDRSDAWRLLGELHMRKAEVSGAQARWLERAQELLRGALARDPEDAWAWRVLGHTYSVATDRDIYLGRSQSPSLAKMLEAYERAQELAPRDPSVHNALGNAYSMGSMLEWRRGLDPRDTLAASRAAYEQALALAPDSPNPMTNMAITAETQIDFERNRGLDPRPTAAAAEAWLDQLLARVPRQAAAQTTKARLWELRALDDLDHGRDPTLALERCITAAETALETESRLYARLSLVGCQLTQARLSWLEGQELAAGLALADRSMQSIEAEELQLWLLQAQRHAIEAAAKLAPSPDLARVAVGRGREALQRLLSQEPQHGQAHLLAGRLEMLRAQLDRAGGQRLAAALDRAETHLQQAVASLPQRPAPLLRLAEVQRWRLELGSASDAPSPDQVARLLKVARAHLDSALALNPRLHEAKALRGTLLLLESQSLPPEQRAALQQQGVSTLEEALESNPWLRPVYGATLQHFGRGAS